MIRHCAGLLLSLILFGGTSLTAVADEALLTIESSTMQPSVVLGRPMLTWWDVKIRGSGLVVGQFQFVIKSEDQVLATVQTDELTLNGPEQRIRVLLPAIESSQPLDQLNVEISFHGKRFSGKVSHQILRIPFSARKVFVGLVAESRTARKQSSHRERLMERLKFETVMPDHVQRRGDDDDREFVKTFFASIDSADFPTEPLAYCGYDIIILPGDGFRALRKPQLQALLEWVKAGGSLYVEPDGVLEPFHVEFLRSVVAENTAGLVFQVDSTGKLPADTVAFDQLSSVSRCGLGCVAIRTDDPDRTPNIATGYWLAIAEPLWNVRSQPITARGCQQNDGAQQFTWNFVSIDPWGYSMTHFNRFRLPQFNLLERLMPDGMRMVPLWLLALILFVFVLLIGPGDYYLLGWLRARKLTWLTFPLTTMAVTGLTVWLTNSYMTTAETRRGAIICDLSGSDEIVRTNRFELLFVASSRRTTTEVEKGLFSPLKVATNAGATSFGGPGSRTVITVQGGQPMPMGNMELDERPSSGAIQLRGRLPTHFEATQDLGKWTPQLNRVMAIPGDSLVAKIDCSKLSLGRTEQETIRRHQFPAPLNAQIRQQFGPSVMAACFSGRDGWAYDRSAGWFSSRSFVHRHQRAQVWPPIDGANGDIPFGEAEFLSWIYSASVARPKPGLFTLTSRVAPKGNSACDDLPLLDSTDQDSWLLVVVVPKSDDYIVYRKLMHFSN